MTRGEQNAVIKSPTPLLVGNISLQPSSTFEYSYMNYYIVDDNYNNVVLYNPLLNNWYLRDTNYDFAPSSFFPQLSGSKGVTYFNKSQSMNGFVNDENGYPVFYYNDVKNVQCHFDTNEYNWVLGPTINSVSGSLFGQNCQDTAEVKFGNQWRHTTQGPSISAFEDDVANIPSIFDYYILDEDYDITDTETILKFKNKNNDVISATFIMNSYFRKRSAERSPAIISGDPCLGYYFTNENDQNEVPLVIGSFCLGTDDLTTVPPMVGQNTIISKDTYPYKYSREYYWWVATTIDKNKTEWNIYKMLDNLYPAPYRSPNYILISGSHDLVSPFTAERKWIYSSSDNIFTYNKLKNGITFREYPTGSNITLNIVGLTNFNADAVKHVGMAEKEKIPVYIGNWIAPQPTWEAE